MASNKINEKMVEQMYDPCFEYKCLLERVLKGRLTYKKENK